MTIQAVVFDIGETLLDDSREFGAWADWLGVPRHTFSAVLGAVTAEGRNNAETFQYSRPGFDLAAERQRREDAGSGERTARKISISMPAPRCRGCARWGCGSASDGCRWTRRRVAAVSWTRGLCLVCWGAI